MDGIKVPEPNSESGEEEDRCNPCDRPPEDHTDPEESFDEVDCFEGSVDLDLSIVEVGEVIRHRVVRHCSSLEDEVFAMADETLDQRLYNADGTRKMNPDGTPVTLEAQDNNTEQQEDETPAEEAHIVHARNALLDDGNDDPMAGLTQAEQTKLLVDLVRKQNQELVKAKESTKEAQKSRNPTYTLTSSKIEVPKMVDGMLTQDYKFDVECWLAAIEDSIPADKRAMLLINNIPPAGNTIKKMLVERVGMETLKSDEGVDELLRMLEAVLGSPPFIKLWQWQDTWAKMEQGKQNFEKYMIKIRTAVRMAKTEFGIIVDDTLVAAKILSGSSAVNAENIGVVTQGIEMRQGDEKERKKAGYMTLSERIEDKLRQFVSTSDHMKKVGGAHSVKLVAQDIFGNPIRGSTSSVEEEPVGVLKAASGRETKDQKLRRCMEQGLCFRCEADDHQSKNCPTKKRNPQDNKRKRDEEDDKDRDKRPKGGSNRGAARVPQGALLVNKEKWIQFDQKDGAKEDLRSKFQRQRDERARRESIVNSNLNLDQREGFKSRSRREREEREERGREEARSRTPVRTPRRRSRSRRSPSTRSRSRGRSPSRRVREMTKSPPPATYQEYKEKKEDLRKERDSLLERLEKYRQREEELPSSPETPQKKRKKSKKHKKHKKREPSTSSDSSSEILICDKIENAALLTAKAQVNSIPGSVLATKTVHARWHESCIADCGCAAGCGGQCWTDAYIESLSERDKQDVVIVDSQATFRFGDGKVIRSLGLVQVPIYIGGVRRHIQFDIVDADIPLLLSLRVMEKLRMTMKFTDKGDNVATVDGVTFKMFPKDGHVWMYVSEKASKDSIVSKKDNLVAEVLKAEVFTEGKVMEQLKKIHVGMAHLPRHGMERVIKQAGSWSSEVADKLDKMFKNCERKGCRSKGNTKLNGVAAFRNVKNVGDIVSADLKIRHRDRPIFYMLDHATGFVVAQIIEDKSPRSVIDAILFGWYGNGRPRIKTLLTDNGMEFNGNEMSEFLQRMNTVHLNSAPYHPEQNGAVERVHYLIDVNLDGLKDSYPGASEEELLVWAVHAYNSCEMTTSYSPHHLLHGVAQDTMSIMDMTVGMVEEVDPEHRYVESIKMRQEAILEHQKVKNSLKLRQFLLRKSRPSVEPKELGTWCWIMRQGEWKGPGQVAASLAGECQLKVGGTWMTCRHSDLLPLTEHELALFPTACEQRNKREERHEGNQEETRVEIEQSYLGVSRQKSPVAKPRHKRRESVMTEEELSAEEDDEQPEALGGEKPDTPDDESVNAQCDESDNEGSDHQNEEHDEGHAQIPDQVQDQVQTQPGAETETEHNLRQQVQDILEDQDVDIQEVEMPDAKNLFKKGQKLDLWCETSQGPVWRPIEIVNQIRKGKGAKYKYELTDGMTAVESYDDFNKVAWRYPVPEDPKPAGVYKVTMTDVKVLLNRAVQERIHSVMAVTIPYNKHGRPECVKAKEEELAKLRKFGAFVDVKESDLNESERANMIRCTWNIVYKGKEGEGYYKARLCARGDSETQEFRTDSPTANKSSLRLGLALASSMGWKIHSLDFTSAFIQGQDIDRDVILIPPPEYRKQHPGIVWKVIKRIYGLRDAPRGWFLELDTYLKSLGAKKSCLDNALYLFRREGKLIGFVLSHVDDLCFGGEPEFHNGVISKVMRKYVIGAAEVESFVYTGWNLDQDSSGIRITQKDYLEGVNLEEFEEFKVHGQDNETRLSEEQAQKFMSMVGILGWVSQVSKPYLAVLHVEASSLLKRPTLGMAKKVYRALEKAKKEISAIKIPNLGDPENWELVTFTDSSTMRSNGMDTVNGDIVALKGAGGALSVLDWRSKKQRVPAGSSLAGEAVAAMNGYQNVNFYRELIKDILGVELPVTLYTDSKSLVDSVNSQNSLKDKMTTIAVKNLRNAVEDELLTIKWIQGTEQPADALTKSGADQNVLRLLVEEGKCQVV